MVLMEVVTLSKTIKKELNELCPIYEFILIGQYVNKVSDNREIDYLAIVDDNSNLFDFIINASNVLEKWILDYGLLIQCYPIKMSAFESEATMFIKNAKRNGRKV